MHHNPAYRPLTLDDDTFTVTLKPGINRCLVKVLQATDNWGFAVRLANKRDIESQRVPSKARRAHTVRRAEPPVNRGMWKSYDVLDGLAADSVKTICPTIFLRW